MDLACQLVTLSVSWAPIAGVAKVLSPHVAQRLLAQDSAAVKRIARFEAPTLKLALRTWSHWSMWATERGIAVLDDALQS
eukprot:1931465-Amphidinium_carterae.1